MLTTYHRWRKMPIPIPTMLRLLDILPIKRSIGILVLLVDVLISVQQRKLLHLLEGQVKVVDNYCHVLPFQCMAVEVLHGTHCGFSMCLEVLAYRSQVQVLLQFQKVLHVLVQFSCDTEFSGSLSLTILSVLFQTE